MPRRSATITQADVSRAIRAAKAAGLPIVRIVVRADGIAVETTVGTQADPTRPDAVDMPEQIIPL